MSALTSALRATFLSPSSAPTPELRSAIGGLAEPPDWLWEAITGAPRGEAGAVTLQKALAVDAVYASIALIAGQVGTIPLSVYRGRGGSRERLENDYRQALLHDEPNEDHAPDVWRELVTAHMLGWGDAFLEKVRGQRTGRVAELWPISPKGVVVERDETSGRREKRFTIPGNERTFGQDTILHIPGFGLDGLRGLSVVGLARNSLRSALERDRYEREFYANDATPGGILKVQGELSPEAAGRLREQWEAAHRGRRRVAVLEQSADWQAIGLPMKDAEFVARRNASVSEVARWFLMSPEMIGGTREGSSLTYSTVEGEAIRFLTFTLNRWLVRIEQGLKRDPDLFADDAYPEFTREAVLRLDAKARAEFYERMHRIGAISPNEIRDRENMPSREGGDEFVSTLPGAAPAPGGNAETEGGS